MASKFEENTRLADMWKQARLDAGKSQEYMAKALGISRATVQAWELGTSSPSQAKGFEWFRVLGLNPSPYYLKYLYPEYDQIEKQENVADESADQALMAAIKGLPIAQKRKLLFLFYGDHGSSPTGILELMTAHLQSPLRDRINIAQCVSTNYKLADLKGELSDPDATRPNMKILDYSVKKGLEAVVANMDGYSAIYDDKEVTV